MKISKRLLFLMYIIFISELTAMNEFEFKSMDDASQEKLRPLFEKIFIHPDFEEIGIIKDGGFLLEYLAGYEKMELLLNNHTEAESEYGKKVAREMNNMHIYQATVISNQNANILRKHIILDARSFDTTMLEERKRVTDSLKTEIKALQKQNTALENKWNNRSIVEKHPYIFCGFSILTVGLFVFGLMKSSQPEYATISLNNK